MWAAGEERGRHNIQRLDVGMTPAGIALTKAVITPLSDALGAWLDKLDKAPSRFPRAGLGLSALPHPVSAFIALRVALSMAGSGIKDTTLRRMALTIGRALADEYLAGEFEAEHPALYRAIVNGVKRRGLPIERAAGAVHRARFKFELGEDWSVEMRITAGTQMVDLIREHTGILTVNHRSQGKRKNIPYVDYTPQALEWIEKFHEAYVLTKPYWMPFTEPPKPWDGPRGGVWTRARPMSIVSRVPPRQAELLKSADMEPVYTTINALQNTPWRVNEQVFNVMWEAWENRLDLGSLPSADPLPIPLTPQHVAEAERGSPVRKEWRRKVRWIFEENSRNMSKRTAFRKGLLLAKDNIGKSLYFGHRLDFRGRLYALSSALHPQGAETMKALLEFHNAVELGETGEYWLGIQGANLWGNDKVSLDERFRWALDNADLATQVAADPLRCREWEEADKPWSFLAWCFEWAAVQSLPQAERKGFLSRLPVALDGSCNGIQHLAAMSLDATAGKAVNLVPGDKPSDIYADVAKRTEELLRRASPDDKWMASSWLQLGINRKITKRPVMVLPYGGTYMSCMDYVREAVNENLPNAQEAFGEELSKAIISLSAKVWKAIHDVVKGPVVVMSWLQTVAREAYKAGIGVEWVAPSGFPVVHEAREVGESRINTRFMGKLVHFRGVSYTANLDRSRQVSGVAPHFVHSMDAAALCMTVTACLRAEISDYAMVHDSYGTHAGNVGLLGDILRDEFVKMYTNNNVLGEMYKWALERGLEVPEPPVIGGLELAGIRDSSYFFA